MRPVGRIVCLLQYCNPDETVRPRLGIKQSQAAMIDGSPKKGGIYRHFSSKKELAAEAFDHAWKAALDARSSTA